MSEIIRVITISGDVCSGKSSIANSLKTLLPSWRRSNTGWSMRDLCESRGITLQEVGSIADEVHKAADTMQQEMLVNEHRLILEGRLAGWLARKLKDVFKVCCHASLEIRVQRYVERENVSIARAIEELEHRDRSDLLKFKKLYGISDYRAPEFYDLFIDTSSFTPTESAHKIITSAFKGQILG